MGCMLGCPVGRVGCIEGCPVGSLVGCWVGCRVGCLEGRPEGSREGWPVGSPVGCIVGCPVGCREGWPVGWPVGRPEGCIVGCLEGCLVGWPVGWPVGVTAITAVSQRRRKMARAHDRAICSVGGIFYMGEQVNSSIIDAPIAPLPILSKELAQAPRSALRMMVCAIATSHA